MLVSTIPIICSLFHLLLVFCAFILYGIFLSIVHSKWMVRLSVNYTIGFYLMSYILVNAQSVGIIAWELDPSHIRLAPEPRHLPLRIIAMPLLRRSDRILLAHRSVQHAPRLAISERIKRLHRPKPLEQSARLFHKPRRKHRRASLIQPVKKLLARRVQPDPQQPEPRQRIAPDILIGKNLRHRLPRRNAHFNCPNQLCLVICMNALSRRRIQSSQHAVQPFAPMPLRAPPQPRPQIFAPRRSGKQSLGQRAQIQSRPAGHNRHVPACRNLTQRHPRLSAVLARSKRLIRVRYIDQMMRHARLLFFGRFGGAQFHAAIHGHGVAAHNLAAKALRKNQRKRRLPAPRRPQQDHDQGLTL